MKLKHHLIVALFCLLAATAQAEQLVVLRTHAFGME